MKRSIERDEGLYQFGPFCLDAGERVLLRDGRLVPLAPKALSTLLVLVRNMGHVVEKDVLMAEVWPDEIVEEGNLPQHICTLRKALGESPNYIETVPRRGYRFLEPTSGVYRPSRRYTENAEAYQAYLKARYCWSKHTRNGLQQAVGYFQQAIELDPNYALAYAGIVDCYLRLATNYLPPAEALPKTSAAIQALEIEDVLPDEVRASLEIRCEWDRKVVERESKRADELKLDYPAVHQWRAASLFSQSLYNQSLVKTEWALDSVTDVSQSLASAVKLPSRLQSASLTPAEEVQVFCVIAREQIDAGNYDAARAVLERWRTNGEWPRLEGLSAHSSADLLFTVGVLAGRVSSARQIPRGQKHAEALLNGAIALFEQLGLKTLAAEGRIELALSYFREGTFDLARATQLAALEMLPGDCRLRSVCLVALANVERYAGHLHDALARLNEVGGGAELAGPLVNGQYHLELATTLRGLATVETRDEFSDRALEHHKKALYLLEAVGHHRYVAAVENNHGYLCLDLGRFDEAEARVLRSRMLYDALGDKIRCAQADDTLAHLHVSAKRFDLAEQAVARSVAALEDGGEDAFFAESLTTQGLVLCKLGRHREAKRILDRARQIADRCGDSEGACIALLTVIEEMGEQLDKDESLELAAQLDRFLASSQKASTIERIRKCLELITPAHVSLEAQRGRWIHAQNAAR